MEVNTLGEVLAQQAVGVLAGAALPGAVGMAEVDGHVSIHGKALMLTHLEALVVGQALADGLW